MTPRHMITTIALAAIVFAAALAATSHAQPDRRFSDVPARHFAADAIEWAAANGVASGYGGGIFKPDEPVTRAQAVTFLRRYHANVATCWTHTFSGRGESGSRLISIELAPGAYDTEVGFSNMRIDALSQRQLQLKVRGRSSRVGSVVVHTAGPIRSEVVAASPGRSFIVKTDPDEGEVQAGRVSVWLAGLWPEERWAVTFSQVC